MCSPADCDPYTSVFKTSILFHCGFLGLTHVKCTEIRFKHEGSPLYKSLRQPQIDNWRRDEAFAKSFLTGVHPMVSNSYIAKGGLCIKTDDSLEKFQMVFDPLALVLERC